MVTRKACDLLFLFRATNSYPALEVSGRTTNHIFLGPCMPAILGLVIKIKKKKKLIWFSNAAKTYIFNWRRLYNMWGSHYCTFYFVCVSFTIKCFRRCETHIYLFRDVIVFCSLFIFLINCMKYYFLYVLMP